MPERITSLIAAIDSKRGIGRDGKIPWNLPGDQKYFKEVTLAHPVVMGRKTHESIGRLLPGRLNIVITRDPNYQSKNHQVVIAHSLEEVQVMLKNNYGETFIIGGGEIYGLAVELAQRIYLTIIDGDFQADTFFPDYEQFTKIIRQEEFETQGEDRTYKYKHLILER